MATTIKKITLWRAELPDRAGALADVLQPCAAARTDLQAVMGYQLPGDKTRAVIEVWPVSGRKAVAAAQSAGLAQSAIPALRVEGQNSAGLGHMLARAIGDAGISMTFLVAQVVGRRYSVVLGFPNEEACARAAKVARAALR